MAANPTQLTRATGGRGRPRTPDSRRWLFMRVSGVLLAVLVAGHLFDTTVLHDAADVDSEFLARRWRNPFWRTWDAALLSLGIAHGAHGVRAVVEDMVQPPARRLAAVTVLAVVTGLVALLAAVTVFAA